MDDLVKRLRGEQALQQQDYGRGLTVLDEAADEIERLKKQLDEFDTYKLTMANAALQAELTACQKDAERYRWLRDRCTTAYMREHVLFESDWDAAIDAAMKGEK